jgi:hypothetical protein
MEVSSMLMLLLEAAGYHSILVVQTCISTCSFSLSQYFLASYVELNRDYCITSIELPSLSLLTASRASEILKPAQSVVVLLVVALGEVAVLPGAEGGGHSAGVYTSDHDHMKDEEYVMESQIDAVESVLVRVGLLVNNGGDLHADATVLVVVAAPLGSLVRGHCLIL